MGLRAKKSKTGYILTTFAAVAVLFLVVYSAAYDDAYAEQPAAVTQSGAADGISDKGLFSSSASFLELPYFDNPEFVIYNSGGRYTIIYDTLYRQAAWVAYTLTREDVQGRNVKRRNKFVPDPQVVARGYPTAQTGDYASSGYDRGHLCPSADRASNQTENDCTFMLSNISPQRPALNRGVWKSLEEQARRWAVEFDTLYVVTGGLLKPGLKRISEKIGIPEYFYKAFLARSGSEYRAAAFIIPNTPDCGHDWATYAVTVDSLEKVVSLDMFHNLPDDIETEVESNSRGLSLLP